MHVSLNNSICHSLEFYFVGTVKTQLDSTGWRQRLLPDSCGHGSGFDIQRTVHRDVFA